MLVDLPRFGSPDVSSSLASASERTRGGVGGYVNACKGSVIPATSITFRSIEWGCDSDLEWLDYRA